MSWLSISQVPIAALQLGLAGAMPFAVLAILSSVFDWAGTLLLLYAGSILAFMGGIQWGSAMAQDTSSFFRLGISVTPALVGWAAMILGGYVGFLILSAAFALLLFYDLYATRRNFVPRWYPNLRIPLSLVVIVCLLLAAGLSPEAVSFDLS